MKTVWRTMWISCLLAASAPLLAGCSLLAPFSNAKEGKTQKEPIAGAPSKQVLRVSQFVFLSDVEMHREQPLFKDLSNLREQVYRELRLPPASTEVFVYLFEDQAKYEKFMKAKYANLPVRRAYFVAQTGRGGAEDLVVYTYLNERTQKDLRHELTHAMLHSVLKNVPIWLDEGLAEYFEVPAGHNGVNAQHISAVRQASDVKFDLDRLEHLKEVHQMSPAEYHEAWAWVHLMLRSTPQAKQALLSYLQDLRVNPEPGPLRPRLAPAFVSLEQALQAHLAELHRKLPAGTTARQ
ncbi:MAG: DUF1570 domain-containing protein [Gemmataceae bacterium]|nr:DUF1570 domain-containing protein [Gemmataceae bacterium]